MAYAHGIFITEISDIAGSIALPPIVVLPTVSLTADVSHAEGGSGSTLYVFTVTRSSGSGAVSVPWAFTAGTTTAADYTGTTLPAGGAVAMADGVTSGTFTISVNGDSDVEPDELFTVSIGAPAGYSLGPKASATGAIVNDDASGTVYADPDLNVAFAFKQKVLSYDQGSGDRAAQLYAAFPALKAYLGVGHKSASLAAGASHPLWSGTNNRIDLSTSTPTLAGYDVQGMVYIPAGAAADTTISDSRIRARADGSFTLYKVQKDNSDALYKATLRDVTLEGGQAIDLGHFDVQQVLHRFSEADNFKGGTSGGAGRTQRIIQSWGEACGFNNPAAHGDGIQFSGVGDSRIVAVGIYSAPHASPYSTQSYGLTNSLRIDASGTPKKVERVHALGMLSAFGGLYPICITPQQTDSIVRNITVADCVYAPAAFRDTGNAGDTVQMHPTFTGFAAGGGIMENVGLIGNVVFGVGPVLYSDRGGPPTDITGIWHWNPDTLDAQTAALWKDRGLLNASGQPAPGMLRSVAGRIVDQPRTIAATGAVPLNLDLADMPNDATITLHVADVSGLYELEYVA
ncbi:MAG: hypothetical protein ABW128_10535 [Rhizorhabdus sp.]